MAHPGPTAIPKPHTLEGSASLPPVNITAGWTWVSWAAWSPTWLQGKLMVMTCHFSTSPTWAHGMGKSSAFKKEGLVYWVAKKNEKNLSFARKHPCNQTTLEFSLLLGNQSFYASPITFSSVVISDCFSTFWNQPPHHWAFTLSLVLTSFSTEIRASPPWDLGSSGCKVRLMWVQILTPLITGWGHWESDFFWVSASLHGDIDFAEHWEWGNLCEAQV